MTLGVPVSLLSGIYTSNKDPISHGGGMLRAVCSTPLSSSLLGPTGTSALPRLSRSPFSSALPSSSASISTTQVRPCSWLLSRAGCRQSPSVGHVLCPPAVPCSPPLGAAVLSCAGAGSRLVSFSQQVFSLAGSTFSLPSSHIFGTPMGTVNPLLTQVESSHTGMLASAPGPLLRTLL